MTIDQILLILGTALLSLVVITSLVFFFKNKSGKTNVKHKKSLSKAGRKHSDPSEAVDAIEAAHYDAEHIFNTEFREELRNRGRLYFENIIKENAMFLQQDLRLTTSQLNDFMKDEISTVLKEEFSKYEDSIRGAKDLAVSSIEKTQAVIEEQRNLLESQMKVETDKEKDAQLKRFTDNMSDIISHYVKQAVGSEIDITDQLEYIIGHMEDHKDEIIEDVRRGA